MNTKKDQNHSSQTTRKAQLFLESLLCRCKMQPTFFPHLCYLIILDESYTAIVKAKVQHHRVKNPGVIYATTGQLSEQRQ